MLFQSKKGESQNHLGSICIKYFYMNQKVNKEGHLANKKKTSQWNEG